MDRKHLFRLGFIAACIADISACSSTMPLEHYAIEHNLIGERQCNAALGTVDEADAWNRPCISGGPTDIEGSTQDVKKEEVTKEEAL